MRPRTPPTRLDIRPRELRADEEYVAFHVVTTDDRDDPELVESLKSRTARGLPPRTLTQEGANPEIADGISAFKTPEAAADVARKAIERDRGFGDFVAELHLPAGADIRIAEWGARGHLTIWSDPLILLPTIVDIVRIREGAQ